MPQFGDKCGVFSAALLLSFSACLASFIPSDDYTFDDFIVDFGRQYPTDTAEYAHRREVFETNLRSMIAHNADPTVTWVCGVNHFADLANEEFKASGRLGLRKGLVGLSDTADTADLSTSPLDVEMLGTLPKSLDWRDRGIISDVKDQGQCGSCWAFATAATIESYLALATGTLEVLSPQQLVSCAPNPLQCGGTGGCGGSIPEVAYNYIQLYGMTTEWRIPYTSGTTKIDGECKFDPFGKSDPLHLTHPVAEISGYQKLPPNDYLAVMQALVNKGPLAVNVQAESHWRDYHSGIFAGCSNMSNIVIDHVVQLVGYGVEVGKGEYWLVRNSWDATWGEKGYIRLIRKSQPECGMNPSPLIGTGCKDGPPGQHVCGQCGVLFDVSYPLGVKWSPWVDALNASQFV